MKALFFIFPLIVYANSSFATNRFQEISGTYEIVSSDCSEDQNFNTLEIKWDIRPLPFVDHLVIERRRTKVPYTDHFEAPYTMNRNFSDCDPVVQHMPVGYGCMSLNPASLRYATGSNPLITEGREDFSTTTWEFIVDSKVDVRLVKTNYSEFKYFREDTPKVYGGTCTTKLKLQ
jgi:hypothetical protein